MQFVGCLKENGWSIKCNYSTFWCSDFILGCQHVLRIFEDAVSQPFSGWSEGVTKNTKCFILTHLSYLSIWVLGTPFSGVRTTLYDTLSVCNTRKSWKDQTVLRARMENKRIWIIDEHKYLCGLTQWYNWGSVELYSFTSNYQGWKLSV